jgi:hypothetical protein
MSYNDLVACMEEATEAVKYLCSRYLNGVEYNSDIADRLKWEIVVDTYDLERTLQRCGLQFEEANLDDGPMTTNEVKVKGRDVHYQTAMSVATNGGQTRKAAQSRASRFFQYASEPLSYSNVCPGRSCRKKCPQSIAAGKKETV